MPTPRHLIVAPPPANSLTRGLDRRHSDRAAPQLDRFSNPAVAHGVDADVAPERTGGIQSNDNDPAVGFSFGAAERALA